MKKIILLVITLIGLSALLKAQNSFPTGNVIWNYTVWADDFFTSWQGKKNVYYTICGDTIVNDTIYNKLYTTFDTIICGENLDQFIGCFRQDDQKVFFTPYYEENNIYPASFGREFLLYDFGLSVGDTIDFDYGFYYYFLKHNNADHEFMDHDSRLIVNKIEINETGQKVFFFENDVWLEGIGSTMGLFPQILKVLNGYSFEFSLKCFKHDDVVKYVCNPECDKCFCKNYVNIKENTIEFNNINIYPNPANDILNIKTSDAAKYKTATIYDSSGRELKRVTLTSDITSINISDLSEGFYIVKLLSSKKEEISLSFEKISR